MHRHFQNLLAQNIKLVSIILMGCFLSISALAQQIKKTKPFSNQISSNVEVPTGSTKLVGKFYNGRASLLFNNKWGFINTKDSLIIPTQFDLVYDFKATSTAVMKNKKWYIIDRNGKYLTTQHFDYVGPFQNGAAKVVVNNKFNFIGLNGKLQSPNWVSLNNNTSRFANNNTSNVNTGCPSNIDFDLGNFNLWTCDTGQVAGPTNGTNGSSSDGTNQIINSAVTAPLANKHTILSNSVSNGTDPYGGFPINSPDGSNSFIKLGSDLPDGDVILLPNGSLNPRPGAKTESVYYDVAVPPNTINLSFIYDYAIVLDEPIAGTYINTTTLDTLIVPIHLFDDKPRFKVEIFDLTTNQLIPCGKIEYVADPSSAGAGGFQQSPLSIPTNTIWYKPWTKRFVNLAPFQGHNIRIKFTTTDCTLGAHWAYTYLDIEGCVNMVTAKRTCSANSNTILDGPTGFQTYDWYTNNFGTYLGSGIHLVSTSNLLQVGDTVNLITTSAPIPFINQNCPDTLKVIIQAPSPLSFDAGLDKSFCEGNSDNIGSSPINNAIYSWTPTTGLSNTNTSTVLASPTQTTMYYISVTDTSTSCVALDSVKVTVKPTPHVVVSTTTACYNQLSTITVSGGDTYVWSSDSSFVLSPGNPSVATISASATGDTFHIRVGVNTSNCIVDTTVIVASHPLPIVYVSPQPPQCLLNNQFFLSSGSFINPGTIASNTWVVNGATEISSADIVVSFPAVGSYPVTLTSTSDFGCKDSITINLDILPMPSASFSVPPTSCKTNNLFQFSNSSTSSTGSIASNQWDFGDNQYSSVSAPTHSYINPGNYTIILTVTADNGCTDIDSNQVRVFPMPLAYFAQPDSQCFRGNQYTFTSQSTSITPSTIANNQWYLGGSTIPITGSSITHSFTTPGTYSVKLVSTSNEGCKDSIKQILMIYPEPIANFSLPATICFLNNNFLFTSSSTVANGFIDSCFWDFGDGVKDTGFSIRHPYLNSSVINYQIQLISQTNQGCRDTALNSFTFLPSPQVSIQPVASLSLCSGDNVTLNATASTPSGVISSYQWTVGGTNIPGANTPTITVSTSGIYQINVTNTSNCAAASGNDTVVVHPLPEGLVVMPNTDFICENENKLLTCNANAVSYQWYLNGAVIPGATNSTYLATQAGIYSVQLFSSFGCDNFATGSISLSLRKKPEVDFSYPTYCKGIPIQFINNSDTSSSGSINWLWNFGDGTTSIQSNPIHTFTQSGNNLVSLSATSVDCPTLIADSQILIQIADTIPGIRYTSMNTVPNLNINLQSRNFGSDILWMPSSGLNNPNVSNPVFNYDRDVEFIIKVRDISGCPTFDTLLIRVFEEADIRVPTAFTPNGDGHNDYLDYFLIGIEKFKRFLVFNRWGQLLFETTDPKQRWDGTFKGKKQPLETYVWLAEGDNSKGITIFRRGQTILLR
jgi:gliding motility-associated-like protein